MEFLTFLFFGLLVVVVVGAVLGIVAKVRTDQLRSRLHGLELEVRGLRRELRGDLATPSAVANAAPAAAPPPLPATAPSSPVPDAAAAPWPEPAPTPPPLPEPTALPPALREPRTPLPAPAATAAADPTPPRDPADRFAAVEQALGTRWLTWIGTGLLFLGIAFFLKYAYDRDWLGHLFGPRLRIATAAAASLGLAVTGAVNLRRGLHSFGHSLLGGGQALAYLTIYAAFQPAVRVVDAPLLEPTMAFAAMALVTAVGLWAAVRLDALPMAFLAVLGGFAAPVLVQSGQDHRDLLCSYLLLLDLGVLWVAARRQWRALDVLAFVGTAVLFGGWLWAWRDQHPQPDATLVWLGLFHGLFACLPILQHLRQRTAVTVERFALLLANIAWTFGSASWLLHDVAPRWLAALCLVAAVLYQGLGVGLARRVSDDRRTRDGCHGLAALLLTLGLFHLLPGEAGVLAWCAEAAVLLWLGFRFAHPTTRWAALAVLTAALLRLVVWLPRAEPSAPLLQNSWCATVLFAGLGLLVFGGLHRRFSTTTVEQRLGAFACLGGWLWTLLVLTVEVARHAAGHPESWPEGTPVLAIAWVQVVGSAVLWAVAVRLQASGPLAAAYLPLAALAVALALAYQHYPAQGWPLANGCFVVGLAGIAVLAGLARTAARHAGPEHVTARSELWHLGALALGLFEAAAWLQRGVPLAEVPVARLLPGWLWLGVALATSLAGAALSSRRLLAVAQVPLAVAVLAALVAHHGAGSPQRLFAHPEFAFGLLVAAVVTGQRVLFRRHGGGADADRFAAGALLLGLWLGAAEVVSFCAQLAQERVGWACWGLGTVAAVGALGGGVCARATGNRALGAVAFAVLPLAVLFSFLVYALPWSAGWMFCNLRFALVVTVVLALAAWSRQVPWHWLRWVAGGAGLLGLTLEPPAWFLEHVAEPAEAARLALFSVTVTWVVAGGLSTVVGFWLRVRALRLVALGLFALLAGKLLVLDTSGAQQLYRILAFVLVGLVFVALSWGYHRLERRLARG
jgi:uncharacterized membrane protein